MARPKKETVEEQVVIENPVSKEDVSVEKTSVIEDEVPVEKKSNSRIKKFDDHDYILTHSVTAGGLGIIGGKTETYYRFNEYGAQCDIEYVDLVQLVRSRSDHIFLPRIIIDDEDFLAEFPQVVDAYNNMYSQGDLREILSLPADQMRVEIEKLPDKAKDNLRTMAATMVHDGRIDSISVVRTLSDIFGADFNLLAELFGDK